MTKQIQFVAAAVLTAGLLSLAQNAFADAATATQTVTYEVQAIDLITVSGPASLTVSSATAGAAPNVATDATTSYAVTINESAPHKITGAINSDMPGGLTLSVTLAAPTGATSLGKQALSTAAVDLVTGIALLNESGKTITYELAATSAAGVVPSATKTVTLTITD
ncbi:MAG: hypothetical protein WCF18_20730 [Chthoniobacteraceae bacterium]